MGESLPTAMEAMSMATGKSTAEVIKLVSTGKLMTKDVLIPFTNALRTLARRNGALAAGQHKLIANQARMNNAFKELVDKIFQGNGTNGISKLFEGITNWIELATPMLSDFFGVFFSLMGGVGDFIKALGHLFNVTGDGTGKVGLLMRAWYLVIATWYEAVAVLALINLGLEKVASWTMPDWLNNISFTAAGVPGMSAYSLPNQGSQPSQTVNKNVTMGDINITSSSTDPKQSAIEMTSMISNLITAGR